MTNPGERLGPLVKGKNGEEVATSTGLGKTSLKFQVAPAERDRRSPKQAFWDLLGETTLTVSPNLTTLALTSLKKKLRKLAAALPRKFNKVAPAPEPEAQDALTIVDDARAAIMSAFHVDIAVEFVTSLGLGGARPWATRRRPQDISQLGVDHEDKEQNP